MKNIVQVRFALSTSVLALCAIPTCQAVAQTATPASAAVASPSDDATAAPDIVVTGTSGRQVKFEAPYTISTISNAQIQQRAPHSVADLLKSTPGITVEASGGEGGGENIVIRGLPWSGWRLIDLNVDGMPLFESNTERFLNVDELYRVDLNTDRAEIVRGGTAPIFSNNASGGVVNFITNHGSDTFHGALKLETGTGNRLRGDFQISGPVTDRFSINVGGFYRKDDGIRYPGFRNADDGGQIKVAARYKLDGGSIWADFTYLNDRSLFDTAVPLNDPTTGASLRSLIDPRTGSLSSGSFNNVTLRTLDASGNPVSVRRSLQDGIHPDFSVATLGFEHELPLGLHIADTYRHTAGTTGFDGIFNGSPVAASTFLAGQLSKAQAGFAGATSLRYTIAGSGAVFDPATTGNLVMANNWNSIRTRTRYDANDIKLTKTLDTSIGQHNLTGGFYYSDYSYNQTAVTGSLLVNVKNNPDALNIEALNAAGQVIGSVTENGFLSYGAGTPNGSLSGHSSAFYFADSWKITPNFTIDGGVRRVIRTQNGVQGVVSAPANANPANPNGPLAARSVTGIGSYIPRSESLKGTSWTAAASYIFSPKANVFARYTSTFSFPRFDTILLGATLPGSTTPLPVTDVKQAEAGFKFNSRFFTATITVFQSKFDNLNGGTQVINPLSGATTNSNILFSSRTRGLELEAIVRPLPGLEIAANGMLQDPKIISVTTLTGAVAASSQGGDITRVPRAQLSIMPTYHFEIAGTKASVYGNFFTIGRRFQDASNLSRLPAYSTLDLGASVEIRGFELRGAVNNVTNAVGLTEGNARAPVIGSGTGVLDATVGRSIFGRNFTVSLMKRW